MREIDTARRLSLPGGVAPGAADPPFYLISRCVDGTPLFCISTRPRVFIGTIKCVAEKILILLVRSQ